MSTALLPVTLSMLCAGMAGIFLVLGVLVLGVYACLLYTSPSPRD